MQLEIQFARELDFFLKPHRQHRPIVRLLNRRASIKDIIEAAGVPHTEVGSIRYNAGIRNFAFIPLEPGRVSVWGIRPPFDVTAPSLLRPTPLKSVRFVADVNVMKLGRLLLLMGFDTACSSVFSDRKIADLSERENRIVLTRDTLLLKRKKVVFGRRVRSHLPYDQLSEVVRFFGLEKQVRFLSRCSHCNVLLEPKGKSEVLHLLEPKTRMFYHRFLQCPQCKKVFWKGSHCRDLAKRFEWAGIRTAGKKNACAKPDRKETL